MRIDGGEWKLIDPCWGAGHIECEKKDPNRPYIKSFTPRMFTMSNEEFGERHYPEDDRYFFRQDGRRPSFQEYFAPDQGPGRRQVYSDAVKLHGISERSVLPEPGQIAVDDPAAPTVRFQCERVCRHWDPVRNGEGEPYLFVVKVNGVGGGSEEWIPLQTDGFFTWCDVPREKLGRARSADHARVPANVAGWPGWPRAHVRGVSAYEEPVAELVVGWGCDVDVSLRGRER